MWWFWTVSATTRDIVIMPAMGMVSEVLATNARKPIFGYRAMIGSRSPPRYPTPRRSSSICATA